MKKIESLCKEAKVMKLYSFGSVNTKNFNTDSDIDLIVEFGDLDMEGEYGDMYFKLIDEFENIFQRKVDLVTVASIKNPFFKQEVNNTKQLLFAA